MQQPSGSALEVPAATIRPLHYADLSQVLRKGMDDFGANRTDIIFLCVLYPVLGLLMAQAAIGRGILPMLFPLMMGFALVGPVAAVGLNEMSRRRELGEEPSWRGAFGVLRSPSLPGIVIFAAVLAVIFAAWLIAAQAIYGLTMGASEPVSARQFVHDVLLTGPGWGLIVLGMGTGLLFALVVLSISLVTFPMLLDRRVSVVTAMGTSLAAMKRNPRVMLAWGLIVAVSLVVGSLPALLGLAFVLPILGHATWHLYRRMVVPGGDTV